jgi:hypothetical protein
MALRGPVYQQKQGSFPHSFSRVEPACLWALRAWNKVVHSFKKKNIKSFFLSLSSRSEQLHKD